MYFIELIIKKIIRKKDKPICDVPDNERRDYECCEHTFMPVDSENEILSCTKCGFMAKRSNLANKNFFAQDFKSNNDLI